MRASENPVATIPEHVLVTSAHPDIVLVGEDKVTLIEFTIPHNSPESLSSTTDRKSHKEYIKFLVTWKRKALPLAYTL